jgi:hypothetical protein
LINPWGRGVRKTSREPKKFENPEGDWKNLENLNRTEKTEED